MTAPLEPSATRRGRLHPFPADRIAYAHGPNDALAVIWDGKIWRFSDPEALADAVIDIRAGKAAQAARDAAVVRRCDFDAAPAGARLAFDLAADPRWWAVLAAFAALTFAALATGALPA